MVQKHNILFVNVLFNSFWDTHLATIPPHWHSYLFHDFFLRVSCNLILIVFWVCVMRWDEEVVFFLQLSFSYAVYNLQRKKRDVWTCVKIYHCKLLTWLVLFSDKFIYLSIQLLRGFNIVVNDITLFNVVQLQWTILIA